MSPPPELELAAHHGGRSSHELAPSVLKDMLRLASFNWLVAAYAHRQWLGEWAKPLEACAAGAEPRLLHRASASMLDLHGLRHRYLRRWDTVAWLFLPMRRLKPAAQAVGVAMLGGWVRNGLDRRQVAQQLIVLGHEQRVAALEHAATLKALPFSPSGEGWPLARQHPEAVAELGFSCLASLLLDDGTGARDRFLLRFAPGQLCALELDLAQRDEAQGLLSRHMKGATSDRHDDESPDPFVEVSP